MVTGTAGTDQGRNPSGATDRQNDSAISFCPRESAEPPEFPLRSLSSSVTPLIVEVTESFDARDLARHQLFVDAGQHLQGAVGAAEVLAQVVGPKLAQGLVVRRADAFHTRNFRR